MAPSSPSWVRPVRSCLLFIGSASSTIWKSSGAKKGSPVNCSSSPSVSVSPSCSTPWLGRPMMSPGQASSTSSRRCDRKDITLVVRNSLPLRTTFSFMPRSKRPDETRRKAMRSRWAGSMLAWILNTTPENFSSDGSTVRCRAGRAPGGGARSTSASSTSRTPKLLMAEPKNTGVCLPARKASRSKGSEAPLTSSISPWACS